MSLHETIVRIRRPLRAAAVLLIGAGAGGCFQPMYADPAVMASVGVPGGLRSALASVEILQIDAPKESALARMAVEVRNALAFDFTGGGDREPPRYRLKIALTSNVKSLIVDPSTARPEFETAGVDAVYSLTPLTTPGPSPLTATATASVTYNIPGQQQRFAKLRGQREAESRAAKVIAEQIKARVAAHLAAGA